MYLVFWTTMVGTNAQLRSPLHLPLQLFLRSGEVKLPIQ